MASRTHTCPACGADCITRRPSEYTTIHECPDCDPVPTSKLVVRALVEVTTTLAVAIARLPGRLARYVYRRVV